MTLLVGALLFQPHPGRLALVNWTPQERSCITARSGDRWIGRHSLSMSAQAPKPRFSPRAGASSWSASVGAPSIWLRAFPSVLGRCDEASASEIGR